MSTLGDFLRRRRADIQPGDVGLPAGRGRRVHGLRREEVAALAGVSVDYYVRLEQGRESSPSAQVLDALSRALRLDHDGRAYLHRLAGSGPRLPRPTEHVTPELEDLLHDWTATPALVLGRAYDVLAANALGEALFRGFAFSRNLVETVFLDPAAAGFYRDWDAAARSTVAGLRALEGAYPEDPRIRAVVERVSAGSPEFVRLRDEHRAAGKTTVRKSFVHPDVGTIDVRMHTFDVRSAPGQELVVYQPVDAPSREALALLGSLLSSRS